MNNTIDDTSEQLDFLSILTEEEKKYFGSISKKIQKYQQDIALNAITGVSESENTTAEPYNIEAPRHITDYEREVLIRVVADVTTIDPQSRLLESIETTHEELYHIPIPSGSDYIKHLSEFFQTFDKDISNCAVEINKMNHDKKKQS